MRPSTRQLFVIVLFAAIFVMAAHGISDPDFYWHLRTGQYIVETGTIPHSDPFSFTAEGREWVTHEWLSEVLIFLLYRAGGFLLLILTFAVLVTAAFLIAYRGCEGKPFVAGFVVLLASVATGPTWDVRPQMLSLLLTAVFLSLLEEYRLNGNWKRIGPLVPLTILWVNLHSGFAIGLVLVGVYLFAISLEAFLDKNTSLQIKKPRNLAIIFLLMLACVILNPNGARMYTYPLETLTSAAMQKYIQEWFSPDFHLLMFQPFGLLLIALIGAALWAGAKIPLTSIILCMVFGYAALRSARNIPFFALAAVPVLSREVAEGIRGRGWLNHPKGNSQFPERMGYINAAIIVLIVGIAGARLISAGADQAEVEKSNFPAGAVGVIASEKPAGNIYNSYGWGGYLIWKLYPEYRVFIDGRADVYGDQFIEDYLRIYRAEPGWKDQLDRRGVRLALVEPDAPIAAALSQSPDWRRVYVDAHSIMFEKN